MGFNTTVVVLNDSLGAIENDPHFGRNLARAITQQSGQRIDQDVPAYSYDAVGDVCGIHCNAATVIESHHADGTAIVAVGQNMGTRLDEVWCVGNPWTDEGKLDILKQMADKMGYRVVKKDTKR